MTLQEIDLFTNTPGNLRIVSRADFDGIVCAVLLRNAFKAKLPLAWERPENIQHGTADIQSGDILANLPFDPRALLWFDHHYTNRPQGFFRGRFEVAPSSAVVIFRHYAGHFTRDFTHLVAMADKIDAAELSYAEIAEPYRFKELFLAMTVSDREKQDVPYWDHIVDLLDTMTMEEVITDKTVAMRFAMVRELQEEQKILLQKVSYLDGNTVVCDFRGTDAFRYENRFYPYTLFPEAYANVKISHPNGNRDVTGINAGYSILNKNCKVNMGVLLSAFGGGGHQAAAACRFDTKYAEKYVPIILATINRNEELPEDFAHRLRAQGLI